VKQRKLGQMGQIVDADPQESSVQPARPVVKHRHDFIGAAILVGVVTGAGAFITIFVWASPDLRPHAALILAVVAVCSVGLIGYRMYREERRKDLQVSIISPTPMNMLPGIFDRKTKTIIQGRDGALPTPVPAHYAPSIHYHDSSRVTGITEEREPLPASQQIKAVDIHIPTFRELLAYGEIGPGQQDLLLCHELLRDEDTGVLTGEIAPWRGGVEKVSTNFLGGSSKSGKTTLMTFEAGQGALMNALYLLIDPHLGHPEKSLAKKLEALSHAFILPPAQTDAEIRALLDFASGEGYARINGIETRYSGRLIVCLFDEVVALMSRAQRTSDKDVVTLYRDLAYFMRDLGTQYNKFEMNGVFASQYITKDAFRLPGGPIDFRDGCQSQTLLKLPPNQAQSMRLLDRTDLPGVRALPPGHGYMGFADGGDVIRMASGMVTKEDIEYVASLTQPSPDRRKQFPVPEVPRMEDLPLSSTQASPQLNNMNEPVYTPEQGSGRVPVGFREGTESESSGAGSGDVPAFTKTFTPGQEARFLQLYHQHGTVKKAIAEMHISYGDYQAYASWLIKSQQKG
jgi:hypothetical protein